MNTRFDRGWLTAPFIVIAYGRKFWVQILRKDHNFFTLHLNFILIVLLSSCATIYTPGPATAHQHKPKPGEPKREIRAGYFVLDCFFTPFLVVDFATHKIWKP